MSRRRIRPAHHSDSILVCHTAGQTSLNKELKPKVKAKAAAKAKLRYVMKTHKKKGSMSVVCAIVDNTTGKQVCQLSNYAHHQNKTIVEEMVEEMNAGRKTPERAKAAFDKIKAHQQFQKASAMMSGAEGSS